MKSTFTAILTFFLITHLNSQKLEIISVDFDDFNSKEYRVINCNLMVKLNKREFYLNSYTSEITWSRYELISTFGYFYKNILYLPVDNQASEAKIPIILKHLQKELVDTFYIEIPRIEKIKILMSNLNNYYPGSEIFFAANCHINLVKSHLIEKIETSNNGNFGFIGNYNITINNIPIKNYKFIVPNQSPENGNKIKIKISHKHKTQLSDSFEFKINYKIYDNILFTNDHVPPKAKNGHKGETGYLGEKAGKGENGQNGLKGYDGQKVSVLANIILVDNTKYIKYKFYIKDTLVKTIYAMADSHQLKIYNFGGKGGEGGDGGRGGKGNKVYCFDCFNTFGKGGDGGNGGNGGDGGDGGTFEITVTKEALVFVSKNIEFISMGGEGGKRGSGGYYGQGEPKFNDPEYVATSGIYNGKFGDAGFDGKKGHSPKEYLFVYIIE